MKDDIKLEDAIGIFAADYSKQMTEWMESKVVKDVIDIFTGKFKSYKEYVNYARKDVPDQPNNVIDLDKITEDDLTFRFSPTFRPILSVYAYTCAWCYKSDKQINAALKFIEELENKKK